jgi:hypothetical protein
MSNWVTGVACIMVLLVFIVAGFMIASDWIRLAIQQVQLGSFMYEPISKAGRGRRLLKRMPHWRAEAPGEFCYKPRWEREWQAVLNRRKPT